MFSSEDRIDCSESRPEKWNCRNSKERLKCPKAESVSLRMREKDWSTSVCELHEKKARQTKKASRSDLVAETLLSSSAPSFCDSSCCFSIVF